MGRGIRAKAARTGDVRRGLVPRRIARVSAAGLGIAFLGAAPRAALAQDDIESLGQPAARAAVTMILSGSNHVRRKSSRLPGQLHASRYGGSAALNSSLPMPSCPVVFGEL